MFPIEINYYLCLKSNVAKLFENSVKIVLIAETFITELISVPLISALSRGQAHNRGSVMNMSGYSNHCNSFIWELKITHNWLHEEKGMVETNEIKINIASLLEKRLLSNVKGHFMLKKVQ